MSTAVSPVHSLDLTDPATFVTHDPRDFWREVRRRETVYWHEATERHPGFWVVAGHADVQSAYNNPEALSSARGTVLDVLLRGDDSAGGRMLAVSDRPRHRLLRNLMQRAFSPRVLHGVAERIRQRTTSLVGAMTGTGPFDFATQIAEHIPMQTICDLLSIPEQDRQQLLEWNKRTLSSPTPDADELDSLSARNEIVLYFMELADERRLRPGDDVVSMLATAVMGDGVLPLEDVALNCYSLILGGDESSRMSAISTIRALAEHPDQWQALREGRVPIDIAVEELLRWATPAMHFARTATRDLVIGGKDVRAGDIVTLWNTSANDDETVFEAPGDLNLSRTPNKHISFGHGPHFCIGSYLGRSALNALLRSLVESVADFELVGEPTRIYSNFLFGYRSLPVRFRPRGRG
ncbi:cytochrome P450 [Streptomyces natalensis]|uniref:Cytochrome P450 n=1 Tax=Streptomyces natalensis ATCC 27448 TaxID=1240678 RepID=A0A0D7CME6_9ACTN|nr:cytochrome P450 [Streptomyces natalensis]KIZ16617.1 cytochrome P450 [Streptomyces natalensis ATCC 27448]